MSPAHGSIPFLKALQTDYYRNIAIEDQRGVWSNYNILTFPLKLWKQDSWLVIDEHLGVGQSNAVSYPAGAKDTKNIDRNQKEVKGPPTLVIEPL